MSPPFASNILSGSLGTAGVPRRRLGWLEGVEYDKRWKRGGKGGRGIRGEGAHAEHARDDECHEENGEVKEEDMEKEEIKWKRRHR